MAADPFSATPQGAAVSTGAQFIQNYLAQQAAREKEKREAMARAAAEEQKAIGDQVGNQQGAFRDMMGAYGKAFL